METKVTKNDLLGMLTETVLANTRALLQQVETKISEANFITDQERRELVALAVPEADTQTPFNTYRYGGGYQDNGGITIRVNVPEAKLPKWYKERRAAIRKLANSRQVLEQTVERLRERGASRTTVMMGLLDQTEDGRKLLDLIKKISVQIPEPTAQGNNQQGG